MAKQKKYKKSTRGPNESLGGRREGRSLVAPVVKGLDVGTAFIYSAQKAGPEVAFKKERNAFFDIEHSDFTEDILKKSNVKYALKGNRLYIVGEDAIKFANVFSKNTRRPLRDGVISPQEEDALPVIELIIKSVLGTSRSNGELIYYAVPSSPVDADFDIIYHQNIIKRFLENLGYQAKPINEGLSVIFSELAKDNFTGIGISLGGGMANVCFAVMALPVFSFSVARAGDWIDEQVARVTNETVSKITAIKETNLNLNLAEYSTDKIDQALYIYYSHLIGYVLEQIKNEFEKNPKPKLDKPLPIALSGGTAKPKGFLPMFKAELEKTKLPFEVGEIKLASHPLFSVVKGVLIAGIAESKKSS